MAEEDSRSGRSGAISSAPSARELIELADDALSSQFPWPKGGRVLRALFGDTKSRAMVTLAERMQRLDVNGLSRLDVQVRQQWGLPEGWHTAGLQHLEPFVHLPGAWAVLCLLTFHANGYRRQHAVHALGVMRATQALPFVILRLNDWVPEVRRTAREVLSLLLTPQSSAAIVKALPLITALEGRGRDDHRATVDAAFAILRSSEGHEAVQAGTCSPDLKVRIACYRILLEREPPNVDQVRLALADSSPAVRLMAIRAVQRFEPIPPMLLERARTDSFFVVRREAFRALLPRFSPERADQAVRDALLDQSMAMRWEGAVAYWQRTREHAIEFYRRAISQEGGRRQVRAVLGVGEHGSAADIASVLPFLESPRMTLRRAAVRALARLDGENQAERFGRLLEDSSPGVATDAKRALLGHAIPCSLVSRLEALIASDSTPTRTRLNAVDVLAHSSKWSAIPGLVRACGDHDEQVSHRALEHVRRWLRRYNSSFVQPQPAEVVALRNALAHPAARERFGRWTLADLDALAGALGK